MKTTDQIAAEAAEKCADVRNCVGLPNAYERFNKIIKAAIEKVKKQWIANLSGEPADAREPIVPMSGVAHASACDHAYMGKPRRCAKCGRAEPAHASETSDARHPLLERIQDYLSKGGLFNPELMEHDKVQQLIMDCRTYIVQHERAAHASENVPPDLNDASDQT